jgi:oligoendopeptidase F
MAIVGVDVSNPEIWNEGFAVLEGLLDRME